ncbi:CHASE2 domain-containing protein [Spirochaetota bacterium]
MIKKFIEKSIERANIFIEKSKLSGMIIAFVCFVIIVGFSFSDTYQIFGLKLYDINFSIKPSVKEWDRLRFIDLDDKSIAVIGQYPWTRDYYEIALKTLRRVGVSLAVFDIIFPDKSPQQIDDYNLKQLQKMAGQGVPLSPADLESIVRNNDKIFASGVAYMGRALLAYQFNKAPLTVEEMQRHKLQRFIEAKKRFLKKASIKIPKGKQNNFKGLSDDSITEISYPIPELMETGYFYGFTDRHTDIDGTFRKIQLVKYFRGRLFFNISMAMILKICDVKMENIRVIPGDKIVLKKALHPISQEIEDIIIPIDEKGMILVNWAGTSEWDKTFGYHVPLSNLIANDDRVAKRLYGIFDEIGVSGGNVEISNLSDEIEQVSIDYMKSKDPSVKRAKLKKSSELLKKIIKIEEGFIKVYENSIKSVEKKLKGTKGPIETSTMKNELMILNKNLLGVRSVRRANFVKHLANWRIDLNDMKMLVILEGLKDHIVLLGSTTTAVVDMGVTPLSPDYPRVGIYHNTVNTVINNAFIKKIGKLFNFPIILVVALAIGFFIQRLDARQSLLAIGTIFVSVNIILALIFIIFEVWLDQLGISLAVFLPSIVIAGIKFMNEENQKRFIKSAFSRYLAPGVIDKIIADPESLELGGENREVTIFFSDVAKFSTISEKLSPPDLVALLNEYLSEMTDIILSYDGTIDKYEGDAIMAFYGAPQAFDDHALKACLASIDMKKKLREMQEVWRKAGRDELYVRMGINSGIAVVGNMGSRSRMDYTAMGDSVNLASRLEGANKYYNTYAMISETTYLAVKDEIEGRKLDVIRVMGKKEPVGIYELLGRKGTLPDRMYDMMEKYYQGLESFQNRDWKAAQANFRKGLKIIDDDQPSLTYIDRCKEYMKKPPPKNWDGVYTLKGK